MSVRHFSARKEEEIFEGHHEANLAFLEEHAEYLEAYLNLVEGRP
jgi:hypothetical protein